MLFRNASKVGRAGVEGSSREFYSVCLSLTFVPGAPGHLASYPCLAS